MADPDGDFGGVDPLVGATTIPHAQLLTSLLRSACDDPPAEVARKLFDHFCSLAMILAADGTALARAIPHETRAIHLLVSTRAVMLQILRGEAMAGPMLGEGRALIDYLGVSMAQQPRELFRVLFLTAAMGLIRDEIVSAGSIRDVPAYPREIMRRSFELRAAAVILVHNHPSGDPSPSAHDIALTRRLARIGADLDVVVQDHILIARSGWSSFRALGLLDEPL